MMNIRRERSQIGWTQRQLSKKTGIERTKLSLIECHHIRATAAEKEAIEKALTARKRELLSALQSAESATEAATEA